ncbi:MAG: PKD domain-containing protein [Phycisphaeraceae bacterium]
MVALTASVTHAAPNWHADEYRYRAIVELRDNGSEGVDVAAVRIRHAGMTRDDAHDYRLFSADGQPVPYQVTFHDPQRDTLISFRSPNDEGTYYIYFGHADADIDPHRARLNERPGTGPPTPGPAADGWIPRAGLVLATHRRPRDTPNPDTPDDFAALLTHAPGPDGAAYRRNIADGYNPFGDSDHYLSVYRGWLRLPAAGRWGFATASNEASFSFLDGEELVHWAGRHTEERGQHGEKNVERELDAGLHYVEYYHEEVLLYQMAFLAYKPPGEPHYVGIPNNLFVQPHRAQVVRYEQREHGPTVMPHIDLIDSLWPTERGIGQYTRFRFTLDADDNDLDGWSFAWAFGDGHRGAGRDLEHVYLAAGDYDVTLTATSPAGRTVERTWPVTVFPVEHIDGPFKAGRYSDFAPLVERIDPERLPAGLLSEYVRFMREAGRHDAAQRLVTRDDADDADRVESHLVAAGEAGLTHDTWRQGHSAERVREAIEHLAAAVELAEPAPDKLASLARLIRHVGVHDGDVAAAREHYEQAEVVVREAGLRGRAKQAFREATLALGDVHLIAGERDAALENYRTAEQLAEPVIPQQVRVARIGQYPQRIEHHLQAGRVDDAWATAMEWYGHFPSDLPRGELAYWIGKLALARDDASLAVRPLRLGIEWGTGAMYEAEARWLLAEAYGELGDAEAQRTALEALVRSGLGGPYRQRAVEALEQSQ